MTHLEFQQFIARNKWIFAKTYAAFCPHEYVVKDRLSDDEQRVFEQIVTFIRENGFIAIYGRKGPNQYYTVDDYYSCSYPIVTENWRGGGVRAMAGWYVGRRYMSADQEALLRRLYDGLQPEDQKTMAAMRHRS